MDTQLLFDSPLLSFFLSVLLALITIIIGHRIAKWGRKWVNRALLKSHVTASLVRLGSTFTFYGILLLTIVLALAILGVPLTELLAVVGIVIIVLGIAMQESISSFAATIQFLLFQPFQVGEIVETAGVLGIVKEIQFFNTVIVTYENKVVVIPNNKVRDSNIINYSEIGVLRADVFVSVSYEDDLGQVKHLLEQMLIEDKRVLADPPATIVVLDFEDSGIKIGIRPFVRVEDFWQIQFDLRERIKQAFDEVGITIPYPQRDVHMVPKN